MESDRKQFASHVEAVLNASQQVVAAYRYAPFGRLLAKTGTFDQPFQFSTKRADARIGMVQYEFRNYLPAIGRWMTRDPLGEAGGLNLYAFVGSSQAKRWDYQRECLSYHAHIFLQQGAGGEKWLRRLLSSRLKS